MSGSLLATVILVGLLMLCLTFLTAWTMYLTKHYDQGKP
jgi:hypothetical protein